MAKRVSPSEAAELLKQGWLYVDVRSKPEFAAGRPKGSINVPLMDADPSGRMLPNPRFLEQAKEKAPPGTKIVLGCQSGNRSTRAVIALEQNGWSDLVEQRAGFGGARDPAGRIVEPGWAGAGLPTESG